MARVPFRTLILAACTALAACAQAPVADPPPTTPDPPVATACTEPRPQMCTRIYAPVCATVDTGIRCITAPCPSSTQKTYGNACDACADPKVSQHVPGECPAS